MLVGLGAYAGGVIGGRPGPAPAGHTVTLVNASAEKIWVGSAVGAGGSMNLRRLPILEPLAFATITIPENAVSGHWHGRFFARRQCTGESGSTFHCEVGDCGNAADHCTTAEQGVSVAELNLDMVDPAGAPRYRVIDVAADPMAITVTPLGAVPCLPGSQHCRAVVLRRVGLGPSPACADQFRDADSDDRRGVNRACARPFGRPGPEAVSGERAPEDCRGHRGFTVTFSTPG